MKNLIVFFMAVAMFSSVFAQQSSAVYPLNPSSMISVQECIDLMNAAKTAQTKTINLKKKVEKTVAEVKKGEKTPEAGAKEIAEEVKNAPAEVSTEAKKAANDVARKVLYKKDLTEVMEAFEATFKADISRLEADIKKLNERMFALEKKDVEQDERHSNTEKVVVDHENRLDNIEEGIFGGYFGAGFMTSSIFDTAGYGTAGTLIKIGSLKGKFKLDLGASLYGSEVKNLLGFEGRGLVRWASEDFKYINIALGGAGGMMADVNNAGKVANGYGGGLIELEAVFKEHYGIATSILLGASDKQEMNGSHDTNFLWCFNVGVRYHF